MAGHLQIAVGLLNHLAKFFQQGADRAPAQIVRDGILEKGLVGPQMGAGKLRGRIHIFWEA